MAYDQGGRHSTFELADASARQGAPNAGPPHTHAHTRRHTYTARCALCAAVQVVPSRMSANVLAKV
eukprot:6175954-Pleurochrysis_carterae.AAC.5